MSDPLLTGAFGIAVALVTWVLAGYRDRQGVRREIQREYAAKLENLYVDCIEGFETGIRLTQASSSYDALQREYSRQNALLRLLSTEEINLQNEKVSDLLYEWSSLYRQGAPKPIGDTGRAMTRSGDSEYSKKAGELWPELNDALVVITRMMAKHLADERARRR